MESESHQRNRNGRKNKRSASHAVPSTNHPAIDDTLNP